MTRLWLALVAGFFACGLHAQINNPTGPGPIQNPGTGGGSTLPGLSEAPGIFTIGDQTTVFGPTGTGTANLSTISFGPNLSLLSTGAKTLALQDPITGGDSTLLLDGLNLNGNLALNGGTVGTITLQGATIKPSALNSATLLFGTSGNGNAMTLSPTSVAFPGALTSAGCVQTTVAGVLSSTGVGCGAGGSSGVQTLPTGIVKGNGTSTGAAATAADVTALFSPVTGCFLRGDNTCTTVSALSGPVTITDASGVGGGLHAPEGTVPSFAVAYDETWADAATHRLKMNNNNAGALFVAGTTAAGVGGNCLKLATNGIDFLDAGAPCSSAPATYTPTLVADAGAGTSPTLSLVAGATDDAGWINLTEGTSPTSSSGIVTINYGGTYAAARRCSVEGSNAAAAALSGTAKTFIPSSQSVATNVVIFGGATTLTPGTVYQFFYRCS